MIADIICLLIIQIHFNDAYRDLKVEVSTKLYASYIAQDQFALCVQHCINYRQLYKAEEIDKFIEYYTICFD